MWPIFYDIAVYPLEHFGLRRWRRELIGHAVGHVLEIGAGTGVNLQYYNGATRVVVSEFQENMLRRATARRNTSHLTTQFLVTDARYLPFAPESFDTLIATLALCTIPQPELAFREAKRVLRPGGQLLLLEHIRARKSWAAKIQDNLTPCWCRIADGCHLNRDTLELAQATGFTVVQKKYGLNGWLVAARLTARSVSEKG